MAWESARLNAIAAGLKLMADVLIGNLRMLDVGYLSRHA
jgi:hypothetical protein